MVPLSGRHGYLELDAEVVLPLPHRLLIGHAEVPGAEQLPGAAAHRVRQDVVHLERAGHAAGHTGTGEKTTNEMAAGDARKGLESALTTQQRHQHDEG